MADGLLTALGVGGQIFSGLLGADAAGEAADTQAAAGRYAADLLDRRWQTTRNDLMPFLDQGRAAMETLRPLVGVGGNPMTAYLTRPFTPADLESTPGYRFTRDQGLKAVQNSYAAKGLGSSGAAMRGAARYATGLADSTFNQQLQNDITQRQLMYNMLFGLAGSGQNAAAQAGSVGSQLGQAQSTAIQGVGNAQASGIVGATNAITGAINPLSQFALMYGIDPSLFRTGSNVKAPGAA